MERLTSYPALLARVSSSGRLSESEKKAALSRAASAVDISAKHASAPAHDLSTLTHRVTLSSRRRSAPSPAVGVAPAVENGVRPASAPAASASTQQKEVLVETGEVAQTHLKEDVTRVLSNPEVSLLTVLLFLVSAAGWAIGLWINLSTYSGGFVYEYLYLFGHVPGALVQTVSSFAMFTVLHDAAHMSLSRRHWFNELMGRLAGWLVSPFCVFPVLRYVHLMHHKYTNDPVMDPVYYCAHSRSILLPFAWLFQTLLYLKLYSKRVTTRPRAEVAELVAQFLAVVGAALYLYAYHMPLFRIVMWFYVLPVS